MVDHRRKPKRTAGVEDPSLMLNERAGTFIEIDNGLADDGSFHDLHSPGVSEKPARRGCGDRFDRRDLALPRPNQGSREVRRNRPNAPGRRSPPDQPNPELSDSVSKTPSRCRKTLHSHRGQKDIFLINQCIIELAR